MIFTECIRHTALIKLLNVSHKKIKHIHSKGKVCQKLEKSENSKGLVDEDPLCAQPSYIKKLTLHTEKDNIKVLYEKERNNCLLILCPNSQNWILDVAEEAGVDIKKYNLPDNPIKLHSIIHTKLKSFSIFIEDVKSKSKMLKTLAEFIKDEI